MTNENRTLLVTIIFGCLDILLKIVTIISLKKFFFILSGIITVVLIAWIIIIDKKYRCSRDTYDFIKFLFFGSENNSFNFFPKLRIYMDYLGLYNCLDVESITFECVSDNKNKSADVSWTMHNVYNRTKKEVNSYYLYTTSELGTTKNVQVEVKEETATLSQDTSIIKKKNGIQCTPFVFRKAIKPGGRVSKIKIKMKMKDAFDFNRQEIVYLYPRNYGSKVKNIDIKFTTIGVGELNVHLHEVKKVGNKYIDAPIKSASLSGEEGIISYLFTLREAEINVQNLYYLLIRPQSNDE